MLTTSCPFRGYGSSLGTCAFQFKWLQLLHDFLCFSFGVVPVSMVKGAICDCYIHFWTFKLMIYSNDSCRIYLTIYIFVCKQTLYSFKTWLTFGSNGWSVLASIAPSLNLRVVTFLQSHLSAVYQKCVSLASIIISLYCSV